MKNKLKQAVSLGQETQAAQKAAAAAKAAGYPDQASMLQVEATFHDAAALAQLQPTVLPSIVAGEVVPGEA